MRGRRRAGGLALRRRRRRRGRGVVLARGAGCGCRGGARGALPPGARWRLGLRWQRALAADGTRGVPPAERAGVGTRMMGMLRKVGSGARQVTLFCAACSQDCGLESCLMASVTRPASALPARHHGCPSRWASCSRTAESGTTGPHLNWQHARKCRQRRWRRCSRASAARCARTSIPIAHRRPRCGPASIPLRRPAAVQMLIASLPWQHCRHALLHCFAACIALLHAFLAMSRHDSACMPGACGMLPSIRAPQHAGLRQCACSWTASAARWCLFISLVWPLHLLAACGAAPGSCV